MILRTAWFKIDPLPPKEFQRLCEAIARDQFTSLTTTGFIIDNTRKSSIEGRYIQKRVLTENFFDPFGNESKIERTNYIQTRFTLQNRTPHLLVIDPPRGINSFITRLGEHCQGRAAIYPPENETKKLIVALSSLSTAAKITAMLISDIQLRGASVAKILIKGTDDIQKSLQDLIGNRRHIIKEAQLEVTTSEGDILKITVKEGSRFSLQTNDDEAAMDYLRSMMENLPSQ